MPRTKTETPIWATFSSHMWRITGGRRYTQLGAPVFRNGEHHSYIRELAGWVPTIFFTHQPTTPCPPDSQP